MKQKKWLLILLFITLLFFSYSVIYTYDTFHYLNYVDILYGRVPFSSWDIVRGPTFPFTIALFSFMFGENQNAHLILQFLNYLTLIFLIIKCINLETSDLKNKKIINILTIAIIIFNPLIFGYYHVLLTEFLAITLTILAIYLAYLWIDITNRKDKFIYTTVFTFLLVYLWFLKQPYAVSVIAPLLFSSVLAIIRKRTIKNVIYRLGTILVASLTMIISVSIWNAILIKNNVNMNTGRDSGSLVVNTILSLPNYDLVTSDSNSINNYSLSGEEIANIKNKKYAILFTNNKYGEVIEKDKLTIKNGNISLSSVIMTTIINTFKHPLVIIPSYFSNYCAVSSICVIKSDDGVTYAITDKLDFINLFENDTIGYRIYRNKITDNTFWVNEIYQHNKDKYHVNKNAGFTNYLFRILIPFTNILYKVLIISCPILFLITVILYLMALKKYKKLINKAELGVICSGYSLLYLLSNAYTGAIIDRYSVEAFIPLLLVILAIIIITYKMITYNSKRVFK